MLSVPRTALAPVPFQERQLLRKHGVRGIETPIARAYGRGDGALALAVITKDADVSRVDVERGDGEALLRCTWSKKSLDAPAASERIIASLVGAGAGVRAVAAVSSSLEEVFAELTRDGAAPEIRPIGDPEGAAEDA